MSEISTQQNLDHNIDLLVAQRFYYSRAKKLRNLRLIISVVFALVPPFILFTVPNWATTIGTIGGVWALFAFLLKTLFEDSNITKAAKVQEEFDVSLFKIPWNKVLVGDKIPHEDVNYAKKKFWGNKETLKDWYSDVSGFPYPVDVLLCQRNNLVWDWRLKRRYSIGFFVIAIAYFILTLILCSAFELKISEYIAMFFLPALSGYFLALDEGKDHLKASNKLRDLEKKLNDLLEIAITDHSKLGIKDLRQIQDCIFDFRKGPMVADWVYFFCRNDFEDNMTKTLDDFRRRFKE